MGRLNTLVESFPAVFIAKKYGFEKRSYFSLDLAIQRKVPKVDFSPPGKASKCGRYDEPTHVLFSGAAESACGYARAYVIAYKVGYHVQIKPQTQLQL